MIYVIVTLAAAGAILGTLWMMAVKNNIEELKKRVLSLEKPDASLFCDGEGIHICTLPSGMAHIPKPRDEFWSKGFGEYIYGKPKRKEDKPFYNLWPQHEDLVVNPLKDHIFTWPKKKTLDLPTAMKWAKANIGKTFGPLYKTNRKDGGLLGTQIVLPRKEWLREPSGKWNKGWNIYVESEIEKACLRFVNEVLTKHLK